MKTYFDFKKGHNSHNNGWILPQIELDLYFMIIYDYIPLLNMIPIHKCFQKISTKFHIDPTVEM